MNSARGSLITSRIDEQRFNKLSGQADESLSTFDIPIWGGSEFDEQGGFDLGENGERERDFGLKIYTFFFQYCHITLSSNIVNLTRSPISLRFLKIYATNFCTKWFIHSHIHFDPTWNKKKSTCGLHPPIVSVNKPFCTKVFVHLVLSKIEYVSSY